MANAIKQFNENKKVMEVKVDAAEKMAKDAVEEFIGTFKDIVKDATKDELEQVLNSDELECEDKLALIAAFAETHDADGMVIVGISK